jgi:hypothetical protein
MKYNSCQPAGLSQLKTQANYEGALADRFGSEQNPACNSCQADTTVLLKCSTSRAFDGKLLFDGACAGCRLAGLEVECSFHGPVHPTSVYLEQSNKFDVNVQNSFPALTLKKRCLCAVVLIAVLSCGMMLNPPRVHHAFHHPRGFGLCPCTTKLDPTRPRLTQIITRAIANGRRHRRKARKVQQRGGMNYEKGLIKGRVL